jgi:hypothetical protein
MMQDSSRFRRDFARFPTGNALANRRGAVLLLVAITMVGLLGLVGLAIDTGSLERHRRMAQNAADAAAGGAAQEILRAQLQSVTFATAFTEAGRNGYTDGANHVHVIVTEPANPDRFTGPQYVKVVIEDTVETIFARFIGRSTAVVKATAWGGIIAPSGNCLTLLDTTNSAAALNTNSNSDVIPVNCGVAINSTNSGAVSAASGGHLDSATSVSISGNWTGSPSPCCNVVTGAAPTTDPLAYVTPFAGLSAADTACPGGYGQLNANSTRTLSPGVYCGGIKVSPATTTVTFNPGVYYLRGGQGGATGFSFDVQAGTVTGTGVAFVLMNAPASAPGGGAAANYGGVRFAASSHANLSAPTTGNLAGVLFYQDRHAGIPGTTYTSTFNSANTANLTLSGSLYFPTQNVSVSSASGGIITVNGIVAQKLTATSSGYLRILGAGGGGGVGVFGERRGAVVE